MTKELKRQLNNFLQAELISLADAAMCFNVSRDYLVSLALKGRIKAFKVGDKWYAEPKSLNEFLSDLHFKLDQELVGHLQSRPSVWVKTKKRPTQAAVAAPYHFWGYLAGEVALVAITVMVAVGLIFSVVPLNSRNSYLVVYCSKYFLTQTLIPATLAVYQAPVNLASQAILAKANDELITKKIELLIKYNFMKRRGRVAGEMEQAGF